VVLQVVRELDAGMVVPLRTGQPLDVLQASDLFKKNRDVIRIHALWVRINVVAVRGADKNHAEPSTDINHIRTSCAGSFPEIYDVLITRCCTWSGRCIRSGSMEPNTLHVEALTLCRFYTYKASPAAWVC